MQFRTLLTLIVSALALIVVSAPGSARSLTGDAAAFARTLSPADQRAFESYMLANIIHRSSKNAFWRKVASVRAKRKKLRRAGHPITRKNYVNAFPPKYKGPKLSKSLQRRWSAYLAKVKRKKAPGTRDSLPGVKDFLANARKYYGFSPERIPEREFKTRYAREALSHGLTKDQVVRVYALETGGFGTADMQAGIHPISKKGKPISSALGYAQLLTANSIGELVKHGSSFIARLKRLANEPGLNPKRRKHLLSKAESLRKMLRHARSVPNRWSRHVAMARTGRGQGIHAINIDGDIGPWLQVIKLKGIKDLAKRKGHPNIQSHKLELMNLAGPSTGLEMMTSVGLSMPTVNFFSRRGYERNSIVRGNTSRELLEALKKRMDINSKNKGAIEFEEVFDEVMGRKRASR